MQVITKNENKILLLIKNNLDKYPEKIPYNKIKDILELSETSLIDLLEALQEKNFIKLDSDAKEVHYIDLYLETKVVEDKSALKSYMLNKTEEDADFQAAFISLGMIITLIVYTCVVLFIA